MSGKILIIDPVSTNRIVLRVKMMAAQYSVETCETCQDAVSMIDDVCPDLILINLDSDSEDGFDFCRALRSKAHTRDIAIISTGASHNSQIRFRALDAGADDVLPRPISDTLLLARIRSLLRRRNTHLDLALRDTTGQALGFENDRATFRPAAHVSVISHHAKEGVALLSRLQAGLGQRVQLISGHVRFDTFPDKARPDLFVIHGADGLLRQSALLQLVCNLRTRAETSRAAQLVVVPPHEMEMAAMLMDLGVTDVVFADASEDELALRAKKLIEAKSIEDDLRDRVRRGLQAAVTDPLTGLYNRRYAEAHLQNVMRQGLSVPRTIAMIMLDIDHFKSINDSHGHAAGDAVLTQFADRLRTAIREDDLLARVGGEEFVIVMADTTAERAKETAERIRRLIGDRAFDLPDSGTDLRVTASLGISRHDGAGDTTPSPGLGDLFKHADTALYRAKSAGRDAVSLYPTAA